MRGDAGGVEGYEKDTPPPEISARLARFLDALTDRRQRLARGGMARSLVAGEPLAGGPGKEGATYLQQQSFCVEPQGYPNAPNLPQFPTARYVPGIGRSGQTVYRFSTN